MRFLYSLSCVFLFFNTSLSMLAQCISTFPHTEDFQSSNGGWTPNVVSSWVWGNVTKPYINSGSLCWTNNSLTTGYPAGAQVFVTSPCYDFSTLTNPHLSCRVWWETELGWDGVNLQYSTNGGTTWTRLGNFGDPINCLNANWYNRSSCTYLDVPVANSAGWSGNATNITSGGCTNGSGSAGWLIAQKCLPLALAGQPNVIFRFYLGAGTTCQDDGFAFDDFTIQESPIVPDFTYICTGANTLNFTGLANPCATAWSWNFGDPASGASNTSTLQNPSHIFTSGGTFTVTLTATNPCGRSAVIAQVIDVDNCTTLPVDVLGLKAQLAGTSVHLYWHKPTDFTNLKHYVIERSTDGLHFEMITTMYPSETHYRDTPPKQSTTVSYRLVKVDNDGTYQYSKIAQVFLSEKLPANAFPNPVVQGELLRIDGLVPQNDVIIYDMYGRKYMQINPSQNYLEIPTHAFDKGLYLIKIQNGDTPQILKIQVN